MAIEAMSEAQAAVLEKAIADWETLTRTELLGKRQTMLTFSAVERIKEAFRLDKSGVTALRILNAETEKYASEVGYTIQEMEDNAEAVMKRVQAFAAIRKALKSLPFENIIAKIDATLYNAAKAYGCLTPDVEKLLKEPNELAFIQRDALRAMDILREDVFTKGEVDAGPCKFNPGLYLFWNINSLLQILGNSKESGVTLCIVQDTACMNGTHFAFAIKQGANLVVLSDKPKFFNPDQVHMQSSRGGGSREMGERIKQLRFPYHQFGAEIDRKGRGSMDLPGSNMPAPTQKEAIKLAEFQELPADTLIWLTMVFDLICDRYWKKAAELQTKQISYTGAMIEQPLVLAEGVSALAIRDYKPLQFKPFESVEDVLTDKVNFQVEPTRQNEWMEKLYKDQVPVELLNPLPSQTLQLPAALLPKIERPDSFFAADEHKAAMAKVAPRMLKETYWGTESELQHTHAWVARKNFAITIGRLVQKGYDDNEKEVRAWYKAKVEANKDFWLKGVATGELLLPHASDSRMTPGFEIKQRPSERTQRNAMDYIMRGDETPTYAFNDVFGRATVLHNGWNAEQQASWCYISKDTLAHERATITPNCPEAIALLAGCKVEELPIYLQNWFGFRQYFGNSILSDVDPLECVHNPWMEKFSPRIYIWFCRSALYRLQKQLGLPKSRPWEPKPKATGAIAQ